ncbi:Photosynthetic protein synthase I [Planctomycetales bacterium 10988]|nr:Photosynthetic protein synthase I [Planctomycetales bacterium 10988]
MVSFRKSIGGFVCLVVLLVGLVSSTSAQVIREKPDEIDKVGITEKLSDQIPLKTLFYNEKGNPVPLGTYFQSGKPVILSLNYSSCPMLCNVQLNGLVDALREDPLADWMPGEEFEIVSISIDPSETFKQAALTKERYATAYGKPAAAKGWHFLVGQEAQIRRVADAVGFRYEYLPARREYSHAAVLMVCTPEGKLSRYLYGVAINSQTLKLSLVEASEGKIGSAMDQIILYCFHYDFQEGRYSPIVWRIMQLGGFATVLALAIFLIPYWFFKHEPHELPHEHEEKVPPGEPVSDEPSSESS